MAYIFLLLAFLLNSFANILLKIGSSDGIFFKSFNPIILIKNNIFLIIGFIFFLLNAIFYFLALKNIPISIAYPIMITMSLIIIALYANLYLGEQINTYNIIGYVFIIIGVIITFINNK